MVKIIHHNDMDGRCAGYIAYKHYKKLLDAKIISSIETIEMDYNFTADINDFKDDDIVILDFSFSREKMEELLGVAKSVI
jgi:oligoribonuclease NrnB/cAMP/cGMP phosphodiesterase (DHH superfamily)